MPVDLILSSTRAIAAAKTQEKGEQFSTILANVQSTQTNSGENQQDIYNEADLTCVRHTQDKIFLLLLSAAAKTQGKWKLFSIIMANVHHS